MSQLRLLRTISFRSASCLPLYVGEEQGFFRREGLNVQIDYTPSSTEQMQGLLQGRWDLAGTAADNVVAWDIGQGADGQEHDIIIFMGGDKGSLALFVSPRITSFKDVRGKVLGVDALSTGYAFVLMKLLSINGLARTDYELRSIGATNLRFESLRNGGIDGTLLTPPYSFQAKAAGFRMLADKDDFLPAYVSSVGAVTRSWARSHGDALISYIKAYLSSLAWIFDASNSEGAARILVKRLGIGEDEASKAHRRFIDPKGGYSPRAELDLQGLRGVAELRAEMTGVAISQLDRCYDLSYYHRALKQL